MVRWAAQGRSAPDAVAARATDAIGEAARRRKERAEQERAADETIARVRAAGAVVPGNSKRRSVAIGSTRLGQGAALAAATAAAATLGDPRAARPAASGAGRRALQPTRIGLQ
jgi:hypothetical protein